MRSRRSPFLPIVLSMVIAGAKPSWAASQSVRLGLDAVGGAVIPTQSLGTAGVAEGRMRPAPGLAGSLVASLPSGPLVAVSFTVGLTAGARFTPTDGCLIRCVAEDWASGQLAFLAFDLGYEWRLGSQTLAVQAGLGVRRVEFGDWLCACEFEPGAFNFITPFVGGQDRTTAAIHVAARLARRLTRDFSLIAHVEDYISRPGVPRRQHDVVAGLGIRAHLRAP